MRLAPKAAVLMPSPPVQRDCPTKRAGRSACIMRARWWGAIIVRLPGRCNEIRQLAQAGSHPGLHLASTVSHFCISGRFNKLGTVLPAKLCCNGVPLLFQTARLKGWVLGRDRLRCCHLMPLSPQPGSQSPPAADGCTATAEHVTRAGMQNHSGGPFGDLTRRHTAAAGASPARPQGPGPFCPRATPAPPPSSPILHTCKSCGMGLGQGVQVPGKLPRWERQYSPAWRHQVVVACPLRGAGAGLEVLDAWAFRRLQSRCSDCSFNLSVSQLQGGGEMMQPQQARSLQRTCAVQASTHRWEADNAARLALLAAVGRVLQEGMRQEHINGLSFYRLAVRPDANLFAKACMHAYARMAPELGRQQQPQTLQGGSLGRHHLYTRAPITAV